MKKSTFFGMLFASLIAFGSLSSCSSSKKAAQAAEEKKMEEKMEKADRDKKRFEMSLPTETQ